MSKHVGVMKECNIVYITKCICEHYCTSIGCMLASGHWFGCAPRGGSISTVRTDNFSDSISRSLVSAATHSALCTVTSVNGKGILPIVTIAHCVNHRAFPTSASDVAQVPIH
jgi:hypothetical protein